MKNIKKRYLIIIPIILAILVFGFFKNKEKQNQQQPEYITAQKQNMKITVEADGKIEADKRADLTFKVPGRITAVPVKVGDYVSKWQWLASIDTSDFRTMHEVSLEDYSIQRRNFDEKTLEEYKDFVITDSSKRDVGNEQSRLNKSVSYVELAYRDIKDASLYSPFDGVVTAVNIELGNLASTIKTAITIQTIDELKLTANIAETDISLIKVGQKINYQLDAFENQSFSGTIISIDPSELIIGGVVYYKITVNSSELPSNSKVGMSADIKIIAKEKNDILAIPYYVIYEREGNKAKVNILENNEIIKKDITIGIVDDNAYVEIIGGLNSDNKVVIEF